MRGCLQNEPIPRAQRQSRGNVALKDGYDTQENIAATKLNDGG
jgi:hypothetical protein